MKQRKTIALILLVVALVLSAAFLWQVEYPQGFEPYFKREYYNQFGPLAISVELLIAGYYLFVGDKKTNFALAVFGFTALLDPVFDQIGLFESIVPVYANFILSICAVFCLWLAFKNIFKLKRISTIVTAASFVLGVIIELFFNFV
ncbi:hypothetical protein [Eudoraea chungangensis]|uniref:hypothetical protein n=1 Tax=Eudoraea chungangensis TaxID=1481905 RepID=UPI0023EA7F7A|nr:hypothetical protein [Eudoraea chungangensis]